MAISEWARLSPATAGPGIARSIAHFTGRILADDPQDVAATLRTIRDEHLVRARAQYAVAAGAHQ